MEKLFDETNGADGRYFRTIWYGYFDGPLDENFANIVLGLIKSDGADETEHTIAATHWVFYSNQHDGDAIEEKVRPSLMVRERAGDFVAQYNMSDFDFVMNFDELEAFTFDLEEALNAE